MIALFSFDDVSVCRDDTVVLDAITLEIPAHGITVLVGGPRAPGSRRSCAAATDSKRAAREPSTIAATTSRPSTR